jgi:hypothetical protein
MLWTMCALWCMLLLGGVCMLSAHLLFWLVLQGMMGGCGC